MNEASSRSHALLQLNVSWVEQRGKSFGQLNLVDLAGSEDEEDGRHGKNAKEDQDQPVADEARADRQVPAEGSKHIRSASPSSR